MAKASAVHFKQHMLRGERKQIKTGVKKNKSSSFQTRFSQNWLGQPISRLTSLERGKSQLSNGVWHLCGTFFFHIIPPALICEGFMEGMRITEVALSRLSLNLSIV